MTADKNFQLLTTDSRHPSLHFKRIGNAWSVRVGERYRALGHDVPGGIKWFWIGRRLYMRETTLTELRTQAKRYFNRVESGEIASSMWAR